MVPDPAWRTWDGLRIGIQRFNSEEHVILALNTVIFAEVTPHFFSFSLGANE
ncbi:hypothetical protein OAF34_03450 [Pirellulaceae bacterium]|nr:hypothetical protein [Pirellulaceae bacterium]